MPKTEAVSVVDEDVVRLCSEDEVPDEDAADDNDVTPVVDSTVELEDTMSGVVANEALELEDEDEDDSAKSDGEVSRVDDCARAATVSGTDEEAVLAGSRASEVEFCAAGATWRFIA